MTAVLIAGYTTTQNSRFLPLRWPKPSPVLTATIPMERWPGCLGLSGLDGMVVVINLSTNRARRGLTVLTWPQCHYCCAKTASTSLLHSHNLLSVHLCVDMVVNCIEKVIHNCTCRFAAWRNHCVANEKQWACGGHPLWTIIYAEFTQNFHGS